MGVDLPSDVVKALADRPADWGAFAALPPSRRREYLRWIEEAKRPSTRARRIDAMVVRLTREGAR
jgi:uncharacterized protein YdeI (YjbR/CyaY-like superfamily)